MVQDNRVDVVANAAGERTTPCFVAFTPAETVSPGLLQSSLPLLERLRHLKGFLALVESLCSFIPFSLHFVFAKQIDFSFTIFAEIKALLLCLHPYYRFSYILLIEFLLFSPFSLHFEKNQLYSFRLLCF